MLEDEIPHTHVLLAKRIFRVKLMVSPSLACRIGGQICTAC